MTLGTVLIILYWVLWVVRTEYTPRQAKRARAVNFDLKRWTADTEAKTKARLLFGLVTVAGWLLKAVNWACAFIAGVLIIWALYFIGAVLSGSFVFLGYPV